MPPSSVPPAIRSAPGGARSLSESEIQTLRDLPYEKYLHTSWWSSRRNRALREAGYRCEVCQSKRDLQVHHETYERLGCELPDDLRVVCRGCHVGHHHTETQVAVGLYAKVISEVIHDMPTAELSDVLEEAKQRCAKLKIPYHYERFQAAAARVTHRIAFRPPARHRELYEYAEHDEPISKAEAAGIMAKFGLAGMMKHMPEVKPLPPRQRDKFKALQIVLDAIAEQTERCDQAEKPPPDTQPKDAE